MTDPKKFKTQQKAQIFFKDHKNPFGEPLNLEHCNRCGFFSADAAMSWHGSIDHLRFDEGEEERLCHDCLPPRNN